MQDSRKPAATLMVLHKSLRAAHSREPQAARPNPPRNCIIEKREQFPYPRLKIQTLCRMTRCPGSASPPVEVHPLPTNPRATNHVYLQECKMCRGNHPLWKPVAQRARWPRPLFKVWQSRSPSQDLQASSYHRVAQLEIKHTHSGSKGKTHHRRFMK